MAGCLLAIAATVSGAEEVTEAPLTPDDREHWSFQPIRRPEVPVLAGNLDGHPVDAFLMAKLLEEGLEPVGGADRATLLRRITFDLTGLPPRPEELQAFLADPHPDAFARVVDRLLQSPAYGERWGQHWLDLARFAETDGFEFDAIRPHAWRYRDWVIQALNDDLPYDEFLIRQLAGDELPDADADSLIATGFLLCGPDMPDINDQAERRHVVLNEMTATVGSVFLGLSVGCAQCHDHRIDPISQLDFYRLRAYFDSGDFFKEAPVVSAPELATIEAARREIAPFEKELKQLDDAARKRLKELNPDLQPTMDDLLASMSPEQRQRRETLQKELADRPQPPETPLGRVFRDGKPALSQLAVRGDFRRPGPTVEPTLLRIAMRPEPAEPRRPSRSRLDLARELTGPDQPLVARVVVNRLWQFHFGEGLVRTPSDFGLGGVAPSHPELLDWLACELRDRGWSMKAMHRLIVTSQAYQRSARPGVTDEDRARWNRLVQVDSENRWLGRMTPRRLEGEAIRDALLAVSGRLNERRGGPGVRPPLPPELVSTLLKNQWVVTPDPREHERRSIYLFVRRNLRYPLFEVFDRPDTNASCPRRARSTVAPQALALMNSELALECAQVLAERLTKSADSDVATISSLYRLVYSREPAAVEIQVCQDFLAAVSAQDVPSPSSLTAVAQLCLALFNSNEFAYVD